MTKEEDIINQFNSFFSNDCKCKSLNPNLTHNHNNNISRKMRLSQQIRLRGKVNTESKSTQKINIYKVLFSKNYTEYKDLLFKIGNKRMKYYVYLLTCNNQIDKNLKSSILELYNTVIDNLTDDENIELSNICV